MKSQVIVWSLIVELLTTMGVTNAQFVPPASEEVMLRVAQQEIEEDAAGRSAKIHAESLAKQFNVPVKTVEDLRTAKQGWGEITIRLGLAQELTKTDSKSFPTMTEALARVGGLRSTGQGWGEIAKQLGFKLGPVVSEVQRTRQEVKAEAKKAATAGNVAPGTLQRMGSDEGRSSSKSQGVEQSQRAERGDRSPRPERSERPQRPERPEKPERAGK